VKLPTPALASSSPDTRVTFSLIQILQTLPPSARLPGLLILLLTLLAAAYLYLQH
jgi:hypothetical protein